MADADKDWMTVLIVATGDHTRIATTLIEGVTYEEANAHAMQAMHASIVTDSMSLDAIQRVSYVVARRSHMDAMREIGEKLRTKPKGRSH